MGGSGGSWYGSESLEDLVTKMTDQTTRQSYFRRVNNFLQSLLTELNDRDTEQISDHLNTLKSTLERDIEGTIELKFGGSIKKHTYANGLSDIDMLVEINESSLGDSTPRAVLKYFQERIQERLPKSNVSVGNLAVTVTFSDGHEIQLLPCIKTQAGIRIALPGFDKWSNVIRPEAFAQKLTEINQACSGRVVPTIKLFKILNDQHLPINHKLSGYHIESLAIEAFRNFNRNISYSELIHHFCGYASEHVLHPISDKTGQSIHVDDYLGPANSLSRQQVSKALERLSNRLKRADLQLSVEQWEAAFGE